MVLCADERVRPPHTFGDVRAVDAMMVDLLVQMSSEILASWKTMNLGNFVVKEFRKFPAIGAVALELDGSFPVAWRLWLLISPLLESLDTILAQFALCGLCELARFHETPVAVQISDGGNENGVQIVVFRMRGDLR